MNLDEAAAAFREFAAIIKALRTPGTGCPWDLEQNHQTLRPYLIEEAYEVLDAIDAGNDAALGEELGDLLLQVLLHAQVADDRGAFCITEVIRGIAEKMVRRHPHVFGGTPVSDSAEVARNWERIKAAEARDAGSADSPLDRVPAGLPALMRAEHLGAKAARIRQDAETFDRLHEELAELTRAMSRAESHRREEAFGDLLFKLCQFGRSLGLSAEDSLRGANSRFVENFRKRATAPG